MSSRQTEVLCSTYWIDRIIAWCSRRLEVKNNETQNLRCRSASDIAINEYELCRVVTKEKDCRTLSCLSVSEEVAELLP